MRRRSCVISWRLRVAALVWWNWRCCLSDACLCFFSDTIQRVDALFFYCFILLPLLDEYTSSLTSDFLMSCDDGCFQSLLGSESHSLSFTFTPCSACCGIRRSCYIQVVCDVQLWQVLVPLPQSGDVLSPLTATLWAL